MKPSVKTSLCAAALFCVVLAAPTSAATISFVPSTQTVGVGASVSVDIVVEGLEADFDPDEIVSAFDLDVSYDPAIVRATDVMFHTSLGGPEEWFYGAVLKVGLVDLWEVSLLSDVELDGLQGDRVVLASLTFVALAAGTTALVFEPDLVFGIDVKGRMTPGAPFAEILDLQASEGSITVEGSQIPEPGTALLVACGLAQLALSRQRRRTPPAG